MHRIIDRAAAVLCTVLAVLLIGAMLLNCANVLMRYAFGTSFLAGDELQVFAMGAITFLGALVVGAENRHLRMDVLTQLAPARAKTVLGLLEALLTLAVCGAAAWFSLASVSRTFASGQRSGMADLPLWLPHGAVTIGLAGLAILAGIRLLRSATGKEPGR